MMFKVLTIALLAALAACVGLSGVVWWQSGAIDALRIEKATLRLSLEGCNARAANQHEDKKSDAEIDNMLDLRRVPDSWLLPPAPGSGGLY
jgi:hypothetical protein